MRHNGCHNSSQTLSNPISLVLALPLVKLYFKLIGILLVMQAQKSIVEN